MAELYYVGMERSIFVGSDAEKSCFQVFKRMQADANMVVADERSEAGLVPDNEREVATEVERCLVWVIVTKVFAEITRAGCYRVTIPDQTKVSLNCCDELVRIDESMIREPLSISKPFP